MHFSARPADELDVIRTVRDARFAGTKACPHCGHRTIVRWGGFSGRQRYRCKGCRRTFSDLTRTAFAYSKLISKWPHYLVLMRQSRTLRYAATRLDVHLSTSFRWRHTLLSHARAADSTRLSGIVEMKELMFAHSAKGSRRISKPRTRGSRFRGWEWNQVARDRVLLAFSRAGRSHAQTVGGDAVEIDLVHAWSRTRLSGRCTVFARMPRAGPYGSPIRAAGHDYHMLRFVPGGGTLNMRHTWNVEFYERRLLSWLRKFRGVASKYRNNYMLWYSRLDVDGDLLWARGAVLDSIQMAPADLQLAGRL